MDKNFSPHRVIILASLGSAFEYYDFVIYGMMAKYISDVFFSPLGSMSTILQALSVFALGYFARPLGGTIAGLCADRFGRRRTFLVLTSLMALSTLIIGFLPDFNQIGGYSAFLLIFCRIMQGVSFAGELVGAATIVGEFSKEKSRGVTMSFVLSSTSIGAILATFVMFLLTLFLESQEIIEWGWRLPFILGGGGGLVLFILRKNIPETPLFLAAKREAPLKHPFIKVFREHWKDILCCSFLTIFLSVMIIVNLYFPYYISTFFHYTQNEVYFSITLSLIFSACILPILGWLSDRISKNHILIGVCLCYPISCFMMFSLLCLNHKASLIIFMLIHQFFIAIYICSYFPVVFKAFPTLSRYTGIAFCYNIVFAFVGLLPAGLTLLLETFKTPWVVPIVLSLSAGLSLCGALYLTLKRALFKTPNESHAMQV